ncbi:Ig-like domain-containing protein, partial [Verminephrobacter aporrectodeae]|uniref:Ig-like domain-containing protein n=1 Tax=Verminephrobacter aporrectodeae TaxID=1110389 RepID=UPI0034DAC6B4
MPTEGMRPNPIQHPPTTKSTMSIQLNITLANTRLKAGDTTTVTFAFNEAVRGFTNDDVVLTDANGTLGT